MTIKSYKTVKINSMALCQYQIQHANHCKLTINNVILIQQQKMATHSRHTMYCMLLTANTDSQTCRKTMDKKDHTHIKRPHTS